MAYVLRTTLRTCYCRHEKPPQAPGTGEFGFEVDREKVGRVVFQMVWKKLHAFLDSGDLHSFRFLLNLQRFYFEGFGFESNRELGARL